MHLNFRRITILFNVNLRAFCLDVARFAVRIAIINRPDVDEQLSLER